MVTASTACVNFRISHMSLLIVILCDPTLSVHAHCLSKPCVLHTMHMAVLLSRAGVGTCLECLPHGSVGHHIQSNVIQGPCEQVRFQHARYVQHLWFLGDPADSYVQPYFTVYRKTSAISRTTPTLMGVTFDHMCSYVIARWHAPCHRVGSCDMVRHISSTLPDIHSMSIP